MTTNLLSVIEQLVDALDHCMDAIIERGLNGSPDQAEKWGLQLPLVRAESAITAARSVLANPTPSTTGEAEGPQFENNTFSNEPPSLVVTFYATPPRAAPTAEDTREYCDYCGGDGDLRDGTPCPFCDGSGRVDEAAPSTAGERDNKTEMLAKLTAWLDSLGGKLHTYSLRGIALAGALAVCKVIEKAETAR